MRAFKLSLLLLTLFAVVYGKYNVLFVLTDDQDLLLNGLMPMEKTQKYIANKGVVFQNAYVNTPICCPSRSSILTGKYLHNTGVRNNSVEGNCNSLKWQNKFETNTIASYLKFSGNYTTFYGGKYLNQYGSKEVGGTKHVPPGYDWWIGLKGNSKYYNYTLSINGTEHKYTNEYLTDTLKEFGLDFLNNWNKNNPFFMMVAPPAAHAPFTPADRHINKFKEVKALRTANFNKLNTNKHWLVNMQPSPLPEPLTLLDDIQRKRWQTLLAVDEMIESFILKLTELNVLNNTFIIFTSDHGFHIGQFSLPWDKRQPYETDIKIPFLIRGPKIPEKKLIKNPISIVDIAPSILTLAKLPLPPDMDGKSFINSTDLTLIQEQEQENNEDRKLFIEYYGESNINSISKECPWKYDTNLSECSEDSWCKCQDSKNNSYNCVIEISQETHFKFCIFFDNDNFVEAYDLNEDPYEMNNLFNSLKLSVIQKYKNLIKKLSTCVGLSCQI